MRTDEALCAAYQKGEEWAFEELLRRWRGRIGRTMGRLQLHGRGADDAEARMMLALWRAAKSYDPKRAARFSTWGINYLLWEGYRVLRDYEKEAQRKEVSLDTPVAPDVRLSDLVFAREEEPIETRLARKEFFTTLLDAADLTEPERRAIENRHLRNLPFKTQGRYEGVCGETVAKRYRRGMARLRAVYEGRNTP